MALPLGLILPAIVSTDAENWNSWSLTRNVNTFLICWENLLENTCQQDGRMSKESLLIRP